MRELRLRAIVQPGGGIEFMNDDLPVGESVDVIVRYTRGLRVGQLSTS